MIANFQVSSDFGAKVLPLSKRVHDLLQHPKIGRRDGCFHSCAHQKVIPCDELYIYPLHPTKINPSWIGEYTIPMENMGKVNHKPFFAPKSSRCIHSFVSSPQINGQKWFAMPHPKSVGNPGVFTTFHRRCFLFLPTPP